ncbi:uncharacterized protein LOC129030181 isoform X2 [Pongo pygmaeus]|uniref:uncharacterized protein LOC129030181 isoform X2 n=1 Tax=Pongo pygmaeus TaxID=9600 RepID=UPI00300C4A0B
MREAGLWASCTTNLVASRRSWQEHGLRRPIALRYEWRLASSDMRSGGLSLGDRRSRRWSQGRLLPAVEFVSVLLAPPGASPHQRIKACGFHRSTTYHICHTN